MQQHNKNSKVVIKKAFDFPKEDTAQRTGVAQTQHSASINAFWAVPEVTNGALANCELDMKQMSVKLVKDTYTFNMPLIRNTCDIKMGQRLLMYKEEADEFRKKWN